MVQFPWAANIFKLQLADADVRSSGVSVTEALIKQAYIKRAGLVLPIESEPIVEAKPIAEVKVEPVTEAKVEEAPVIVRRGRPAKR